MIRVVSTGFALLIAVSASAAEPAAKSNRLAGEASAYLRQHAGNPVDWFPWGDEAFVRAKKENKLIFLSVGYSSCHWCHVMERESFSNPQVAATLNEHFVCIKVDREERPDIDDVYLTAVTVTGHPGGWPLSAFLMPDGKPIFGGTYWPPEDKTVDGETVPGFKSILTRVIGLAKDRRTDLQNQADAVARMTASAMERVARAAPAATLGRETVNGAARGLTIDPEYGGIGSKANGFRGAKFPQPAALGFLLRQSRRKELADLRDPVELTLRKLAEGGIFDHLGGGFHRYSTERTWTVPHFEKMLYDNAQLVELYAAAYKLDPKPEYRRVIEETLGFIGREMTSPEGTFYSSLDADTNHEEGAFYVWTPAELDSVLAGGPDAKLFRTVYGLDRPNFEGKFHILRLPRPLADAAKDEKLSEAELIAKLAPWQAKLFAAREKRERPFRDTKIIAGWNGLMIAGYAAAGQALGEPKFTAAAEKAANFVLANLRGSDGRLHRVYSASPGGKPEARGPTFLDDYAYLAHGLLNLYEATGDAKWLQEAKRVTDTMRKWHEDADRGGFYTTAHDAEKMFARGMDAHDSAVPSGNGVAARNLVRLWQRTKDDADHAAAEKTVRRFTAVLDANPAYAPLLADTLGMLLDADGFASNPAIAQTEPVSPPRKSADVVSVALKADAPDANGKRSFTVTLTVTEPWHVYANPVGGKDLEASETRVAVLVGGVERDAKLTYPAGTETTDPGGGPYRIYTGTVAIRGELERGPHDGPLSVTVKVVACKDGTCLLPSTVAAAPR